MSEINKFFIGDSLGKKPKVSLYTYGDITPRELRAIGLNVIAEDLTLEEVTALYKLLGEEMSQDEQIAIAKLYKGK